MAEGFAWPTRQQVEPGTARPLSWGDHLSSLSREESRGSDLWPRDSRGPGGSKWNRALPGMRTRAPPGTARMGQQILSSMVCCSSISMTSRPSFSRRFMMSLKRLKPI